MCCGGRAGRPTREEGLCGSSFGFAGGRGGGEGEGAGALLNVEAGAVEGSLGGSDLCVGDGFA